MQTTSTVLRRSAVDAYTEAWRRDETLPEVTDPERQVALVLLGYSTPAHGALVGVTDQARAFAARYWRGMSDRLRQAVEFYAPHSHYDGTELAPILAAARSVLEGEPIWWCEAHRFQMKPNANWRHPCN